MKAAFTSLALAFSMLAILANVTAVIAASRENPKLDHAELTVSPLIQGLDGTLVIRTLVQVNGTC